MSKKEIVFPLNTIGGKIQHIRKENNLDRIQFYNSINPNDTFIQDDSKYKTVYNWESSKSQPSYETITAICNEFNVSSDFLLGIQKEKNHDIHFICETTGLSEKAINIILEEYKESEPFPSGKLVSILNTLIESDNGETFSKILSNIGMAIIQNMSDAKTPSQYWNSDRFLKAYNFEASTLFSKLINEAEKEYLSKMPQENREAIYSMYHKHDK